MRSKDVKVKFKRLSQDAITPKYMTAGSAGMDLHSNSENLMLNPGDIASFKTGLAIELPNGYEAQVRPRSGLLFKHGVLAHLGTIDSDYRGEILVALENLSDNNMLVFKGDRIAQLVIAPVVQPKLFEVEELSNTERGIGGFGSTGK